MNTIGERIKARREELGLTQAQLAAKAKISTSTIGNLEAGLRRSPRSLLTLAAALNTTATWLETGQTGILLEVIERPASPRSVSEALEVLGAALAHTPREQRSEVADALRALTIAPSAEIKAEIERLLGYPDLKP